MISKRCLRAGQKRPYQDRVYEYEVTSDDPEEVVKTYCLTKIEQVDCANEVPGAKHTGTCGFPFGLSAFYTFTRVSPGVWRYIVTRPFCD